MYATVGGPQNRKCVIFFVLVTCDKDMNFLTWTPLRANQGGVCGSWVMPYEILPRKRLKMRYFVYYYRVENLLIGVQVKKINDFVARH